MCLLAERRYIQPTDHSGPDTLATYAWHAWRASVVFAEILTIAKRGQWYKNWYEINPLPRRSADRTPNQNTLQFVASNRITIKPQLLHVHAETEEEGSASMEL